MNKILYPSKTDITKAYLSYLKERANHLCDVVNRYVVLYSSSMRLAYSDKLLTDTEDYHECNARLLTLFALTGLAFLGVVSTRDVSGIYIPSALGIGVAVGPELTKKIRRAKRRLQHFHKKIIDDLQFTY